MKGRIVDWLKGQDLISSDARPEDKLHQLFSDTTMLFGSEPDVSFERDGRQVATIEVKGGKDPAGALERLGTMRKSFAETPPGCVNFLIAGVVTPEMRARLNEMGVVKVYLLDQISQDGDIKRSRNPWSPATRPRYPAA